MIKTDLSGFVVTMHEGACETGSQIPVLILQIFIHLVSVVD